MRRLHQQGLPGHCATVSRPTRRHSITPKDLSAVPGVLLSPPPSPTWPQHACLLPSPCVPPDTPPPPRPWGLSNARLPPTCPTSCPPDLIAVHPVAMPQGEDLPQRDGNGKANHSNGEGISHKLCEQLGAGGHWGCQPAEGPCEAKGSCWAWLPSLPPPGAGAHPAGMCPTTSTPNLCCKPTPYEMPVAPMSWGERTGSEEGGAGITFGGMEKALWGCRRRGGLKQNLPAGPGTVATG